MSDNIIVKGYRSQLCYFPETTYGEYSITASKCRRIGGKVKSVNWTARQNIRQTGSIGDGRNYKQQLMGGYDASANITWEVIEPSFLRFGMGDIGKWNDGGTASTSPYFMVESELTGVDGSSAENTLLKGADCSKYTSIRLRPFSMLLYDLENTAAGTDWNDNVDLLRGCMIDSFSLSASINTPLMCTTSCTVREIGYRRKLSTIPDFTDDTTGTAAG